MFRQPQFTQILSFRLVPGSKWTLVLLLLIFSTSCRYKKIEPAKLSITEEKLEKIYKQNRDLFIRYFLDEEKNRFNGCVVEKIYIKKEDYVGKALSFDPKTFKFGDGTAYAGYALAFLSFDYAFWRSQNNTKEAERTLAMIERVLTGVEECDNRTLNGRNGFLYRDIADKVEGLTVISDLLSPNIYDKEMSQSQLAGLFLGFDFMLMVIKDQNYVDKRLMLIKERIIDQMKLIIRYLIDNDFEIQSEIDVGSQVKRGPGVSVSGWIYVELLKKWLPVEEQEKYSGGSRRNWKIGANAAYSWYSLLTPSVKDYEDAIKNNDYLKARSWRPNYFQCLVVAKYDNMESLNHFEPDWKPWVERYQNGLAISFAMAKQMFPNNELKKILFRQLSRIPENHLPDNYHDDHGGWNLDNKWIRLMNIGELLGKTEEKISVYNGLDFLMPTAAYYYSKLGYPRRME